MLRKLPEHSALAGAVRLSKQSRVSTRVIIGNCCSLHHRNFSYERSDAKREKNNFSVFILVVIS